MKCKQDQLAQDLLDEYTSNVDRGIRRDTRIVSTLVRGYSKLGKLDQAIKLFAQKFGYDSEDKENAKVADPNTLHVLVESCVKKGLLTQAQQLFDN